MKFDLQGKVALVTGANRGIGAALTTALVENGAAKVYAAVRKSESARPLIQQHGEKVVPLACDLSKPETVHNAAEQARDVQLVVNNAGVLKSANALSASAFETLQFEMDVNVYGLMRVAQAFAPILKTNGGGAFVQLNSIASMKSFPDFATYCASKAAAYSMTQALYFTLQEQNTAVFSVHPGPIATDMANDAGLGDIGEPAGVVADALLAAFKSGIFHVFPDTMARQVGDAYASFAANVVEANLMEG
jgi:NAD(P)-dependent dehydrogenase (short-subunit alcohol dehydrogenase family)